jgi:two-component system, NarL family, sensor histidine kinase DegS
VRMVIEDNGRGFDADSVLRRGPVAGHFGLAGLRERASLLGGCVRIESQPGRGTRVIVQVPVDEEYPCENPGFHRG